jgi:hypothetical protein
VDNAAFGTIALVALETRGWMTNIIDRSGTTEAGWVFVYDGEIRANDSLKIPVRVLKPQGATLVFVGDVSGMFCFSKNQLRREIVGGAILINDTAEIIIPLEKAKLLNVFSVRFAPKG